MKTDSVESRENREIERIQKHMVRNERADFRDHEDHRNRNKSPKHEVGIAGARKRGERLRSMEDYFGPKAAPTRPLRERKIDHCDPARMEREKDAARESVARALAKEAKKFA